jgi:hypothetical protein
LWRRLNTWRIATPIADINASTSQAAPRQRSSGNGG